MDKEKAERNGLEQQLREKVREMREMSASHDRHVDELTKKYIQVYIFEFFIFFSENYQFDINFHFFLLFI